MGLDIHIYTNKDEEVFSTEYYQNEKDFRYKMGLSREFCNLMCRQYVSMGVPEFDQISILTGVDISPIFEMEKYWDEESAEHQISFGETEEEKARILNKIQTDRDSLAGNIKKVQSTVSLLLDKLSTVDNLKETIVAYGNDTIGIDYYFSDFNTDKGEVSVPL